VRKLGLVFLTLIFSSAAFGTPIHPDLKELLREAQRPRFQYMPARAGWNGPEAKTRAAALNPTYEKLRYADSKQAIRQQLRSLVLPDGRALAALFFLILALRFVVMRDQKRISARTRGELLTLPPREPAEQAA
jgi:hypothetical protein